MKYLLRSFLIPWIIVLFLFYAGPITFKSIHIETLVVIIGFIFFGVLGIKMAFLKKMNQKPKTERYSSKLLYMLIGLSIIYFVSMSMKMSHLSGLIQFSYDLKGFTDLRYERRSLDLAKGELLSGVLARILAGFPIICFMYKEHYRDWITKFQNRLTNTIGIIALIFSLFDGGRNSLVLMAIVFVLIRSKRFRNSSAKKVKKLTKQNIIFISSIATIVLMVFIIRGSRNQMNISTSINHFERGYSIEINDGIQSLVTEENPFGPGIYSIIYFDYYITHSIHELDVLLAASKPTNAPYLGSYQFYNFTLFISKLGINTITIEQILSEIPNPGTYFTAIGGAYLDFGIVGTMLFIFILNFHCGSFYRKYKENGNFSDLLFFILLLLFVLVTPIFSIIGIGIYSSFLIDGVIFLFLKKRF